MSRTWLARVGAFAVVLTAWLGGRLAEGAGPSTLSQTEIVKRGREASAFLDLGPGRSATAFCIHPSGLFVTNAHAVANPQDGFKVVVQAGTLDQRIYTAQVVRRDREADLALLKAEGAKELASLRVGSDDDLEELMDLYVFGFPFGRGSVNRADEFPAISVNRGAISSLRREGGRLVRIQLNAAVNPGNSGGPILDATGRVAGVVVGRMEANFGAGVDLAIPANVLGRFLARPNATFTASRSDSLKPGEAVDFEAEVVQVLPAEAPLDLKLVLGAGTSSERRVTMTGSGGVYRARAVPFDQPTGPREIEVVVEYADGSVHGRVEDREIRIGERGVRLSELDVVRFAPKPEALTVDGRKLEGTPAPPEIMTLTVGGQEIDLHLGEAVAIDPVDASAANAVGCTLVVRQGKEEIEVASLPLFSDRVTRPSFKTLRDGRFIQPPRSTSPVSYLRFESVQGDYIGQGKSYAYEKDVLTLSSSQGGVQCQVAPFGNWTLAFGAAEGRNLDVGEYRDAKRFPFRNSSPGIELNGNGRGCNTISGEFRVWELELKGSAVVRLAVDFVQRCEGRGAPLVGMLRYNSTFH